MLILLIVVLLNVWTIPVENVMTPNINILKELMDLEIRMKSMETEMERLKTEKEVPKVAFSASLLTTFGPQSIGPFYNGLHTLIYKHVFLNFGSAYDANTGIFTAPVKGVYVFTVFSKASGHRERAITAGLFKNDQHIVSTHGHQADGFISSSNGVSLLLDEGDKIKVNLYPGQWIFDNGEHHHSTFSGHLLFAM